MAAPISSSSGLSLLPVDCFAPAAQKRGSVWLDSSLMKDTWGRRSIIAINPVAELTYQNGRGEVSMAGSATRTCDLNGILDELERVRQAGDTWAAGYVSYEAAFPWLPLEEVADSELPQVHFFIYDRVIEYDNLTGDFRGADLAVELFESNDQEVYGIKPSRPQQAALSPALSKEDYLARVNRIKWHIHEGDIYQANFTSRFDGYSSLDPFAAYLRLRRLNPSFYGAYLNFGDYQVLSSSPERMFYWNGNRITCSPVKGTITRGTNPSETARNLRRLMNSEKDRAELLMIVDLVRNDLGRLAATGSVVVDDLCRTEVLSSVIHLVADISARPQPASTLREVLRSLLPAGSVTGVPKRRAVEILRNLEVTPRSVYTGAIGYIGAGRVDFNVAIRTMIHRDGCYHIHAGGGIVADSQPEAEYEEMLLKARNLFAAIGASG